MTRSPSESSAYLDGWSEARDEISLRTKALELALNEFDGPYKIVEHRRHISRVPARAATGGRMTQLMKQRHLLDRVNEGAFHIPFSIRDEHFPPVFTMRREAWEDMGRPDQITVTIEPGDHLLETDNQEI